MIEVKRPKFHVLSNFSHSVNISNYVSKKSEHQQRSKNYRDLCDHISTSQITDFHLLLIFSTTVNKRREINYTEVYIIERKRILNS